MLGVILAGTLSLEAVVGDIGTPPDVGRADHRPCPELREKHDGKILRGIGVEADYHAVASHQPAGHVGADQTHRHTWFGGTVTPRTATRGSAVGLSKIPTPSNASATRKDLATMMPARHASGSENEIATHRMIRARPPPDLARTIRLGIFRVKNNFLKQEVISVRLVQRFQIYYI
jgi:hypothetical protein